MNTSPPPAAAEVTSTAFARWPTREPSSANVAFGSTSTHAGDEPAAAAARERLQHARLDRHLDAFLVAALERLGDDAVRRPDRDRRHRDLRALRERRRLRGCDATLRLTAVGEQDDHRGRALSRRPGTDVLRQGDATRDRRRERGALRAGVHVRESRAQAIEIAGRGNDHRGLLGEGDERCAIAVRQPVEIGESGSTGGAEPRRARVLRGHRARDVEHEDDRRVLLLDGDGRLRAREADEKQRQPDEEQRDRKVASHARRRRRHVRQERGARPGCGATRRAGARTTDTRSQRSGTATRQTSASGAMKLIARASPGEETRSADAATRPRSRVRRALRPPS